MNFFLSISKYLSLVKFAHTVFALPFALIGFFLGTVDTSNNAYFRLFVLVLLCMVFARNAAMSFNRYIDRNIDIKNPRTSSREIPSGILNPTAVLFFVIFNITGFIVTTYFINNLCFFLSPVALIVVLGYSFTKRFTFFCHIVLGMGLALAPIGAYIAVTGHFALNPVLYSFAVLFWVSGFDIIYALQDINFDKSQKLQSIPVRMGIKKSLWISLLLHLFTVAIIIYTGINIHFGLLYWIGTAIFIFLLFYQHLIVKPSDLSRVNLAFASMNGFASVIFGAFVIAELIFNM
ncbi:MAG: UbiA family prenyltransferase [Bacteroidetes bacterium]|nr:UbiA family prenyltransferase [Bacteroidota bacterium]